MKKIITELLKKVILTIIGVALFGSLVTSGTCDGLIDMIFIGWRDKTGCIDYVSCFGDTSGQERESGVIVLFLFLISTIIFFILYRIWKSISNWGKMLSFSAEIKPELKVKS